MRLSNLHLFINALPVVVVVVVFVVVVVVVVVTVVVVVVLVFVIMIRSRKHCNIKNKKNCLPVFTFLHAVTVSNVM